MAAPGRTGRSPRKHSRAAEHDAAAHRERLESIGRLSSGIVHDFNNLLTVVYTYCALLERCVREDATALGYVEQIEAAVHRGSELTRHVLEFARHSTTGTRCVDINDVVVRLAEMLSRLLGDGIEVRTLTERSLRVVRGDVAQIEQILINLALNARDAMSDGGVLTIRTASVIVVDREAMLLNLRPGEHVLITVSDTGHGMDGATSARVFEPFFTTKGGNGTGLGLATSRDAVRAANGAISVESTVGVGTTFRIWLPVSTEASIEPQSVTTSRPPRTARYALILVEPNRSIRAPLAEYLRLRGFDVLEAEGGTEAMSHVVTFARPLHVLIADPTAPRMRDRAVTQTLNVQRPDMKILYLLGETNDAALDQLAVQPGSLVLQKPFSPEVLVSHILTLLEDAPTTDPHARAVGDE